MIHTANSPSSKAIFVQPYIKQYFTNIPDDNKNYFTVSGQITPELLHMALVFYDAYITNAGLGSPGMNGIKLVIKTAHSGSDFYRMYTLLKKQPEKMIQLLWTADYLGALELRDFLLQELRKIMSDTEINQRLKAITNPNISLSCDACKRKKANYANNAKDRFFCSYECYKDYKM